MKKILYVLNVNWNWIFQRPQIIAMKLSNDYDCNILNKKVVLKPPVSKSNPKVKKLINIPQLPKENLIKIFCVINGFVYKHLFLKYLNSDVVWFTHPLYYKYLPHTYKGIVVYDCMDYHIEMTYEKNKEYLYQQEQELIKRADCIFVSSNRLKLAVPNMENAFLVRNGFSANMIYPIKPIYKKDRYQIGYIGTVSSWFNYELLNTSAQNDYKIEYHIIGPVLISNIVSNSRIVMDGSVEHDKLYKKIKEYDALVMPFFVNNIILAVDPVKLYEYIAFGKCIISVWYPEIERFSDFVYFYKNNDEYLALIDDLEDKGFPVKYTEDRRNQFLMENTWENRYAEMRSHIEKLF